MFDLDISKMLLVAVVALVVVGPKELPQVLRALGRAVTRLRRFQFSMRTAAMDFMADADLDGIGKEFATVERDIWANIALNPATAMRGTLPPPSGATAAPRTSKIEAVQFASPEMEAYLSLPVEALPRAEGGETPCAQTARQELQV